MRDYLWPLILCSCSALAQAGGGPEGVLLVVNPQSPASLTIANHYAQLRAIPSDNVLYLPWPPNQQTTDVDTFRRRILLPVLVNMRSRGVVEQIDYVVYSSDFPWGIALKSDVRKFLSEAQQMEARLGDNKPQDAKKAQKLRWPQQYTPIGSINGLTYLWQAVASKVAAYFDPQSNRYMIPPDMQRDASQSAGFRSARQYGPQGNVVVAAGQRHYLSMMLGVTAGRGNSLDEVIDYLKRSAAADATRPTGTIYFVKNSNIRSTVRDAIFPTAVAELAGLGVKAEILDGTLPLNKNDVQGLMMGTAAFNWKASGSTILPGALCDNFTSFGGVMRKGGGQTPLSAFLRYGAAGASGTVTEPLAIAAKFPSPLVQVHYARGCTLAEAFYQSVHSPYQLLIVGDPLCRPWAEPPRVSVAGVEPGAVVRGALKLKPTAALGKGNAVEAFELFVDAQRVARCGPGETLTLDTTKVSDGHHDLRIVAIGPAPIESQGRQIIPVVLDNHNRKIYTSLTKSGPFRSEETLRIAVRSPGSVGIVAIQGSRVVGHLGDEQGQIEIPAKTLGAGPVRLRVAGLGEGGTDTNVMAEPLDFKVE